MNPPFIAIKIGTSVAIAASGAPVLIIAGGLAIAGLIYVSGKKQSKTKKINDSFSS